MRETSEPAYLGGVTLKYYHSGEISVQSSAATLGFGFTSLGTISSEGLFQGSAAYFPTALTIWIKAPTEEAVEVDWGRVRLIGPDGRAHPVVRKGQKYADRTAVSPPAFLPPGTRFDDFLFPVDLISWDQPLRNWYLERFFERVQSGQAFSIYLPMKIGQREVLHQISLRAE